MSTRDDIATVLQYVMPMCSVFAFLFVVPILLKRIVHEKEGGVKVWKSKVEAGKKEMYKKNSLFFPYQEFLKMTGLSSFSYWLSWFLLASLSSLVTVTMITILLVVDFKVRPR